MTGPGSPGGTFAVFILSVSGAAKVTNNQITGPFLAGIVVIDTNGTADVSGNQIGNPDTPNDNPSGIGIRLNPSPSTVNVVGNSISMSPASNSFPFGFAIRESSIGPATLNVTGNLIHVTNPSTSGIRIANAGGQTTVQQNNIHMDLDHVDVATAEAEGADVGAIVINVTDNAYVAQNLIVGTSFCGVCLYGSSNCQVVKNSFSGLQIPSGLAAPVFGAVGADIVFGTFENAVALVVANNNSVTGVGGPASISDAGSGNVVSGTPGFTRGIVTRPPLPPPPQQN
jgi:parallel beta-helix repeat protein